MPSKTSGAAIASLVLGIVGLCVPVLGGLVAIILGIVGIGSTGKPNVKGRGLAIAGLILGVLTVLGWGAIGGVAAVAYHATAPDRSAARLFVQTEAAGDVTKAATLCDSTTVTPETLRATADQFKGLGTLQDTTVMSAGVDNTNGVVTSKVMVIAKFSGGAKAVTVDMARGTGGTRVVKNWQVQ